MNNVDELVYDLEGHNLHSEHGRKTAAKMIINSPAIRNLLNDAWEAGRKAGEDYAEAETRWHTAMSKINNLGMVLPHPDNPVSPYKKRG